MWKSRTASVVDRDGDRLHAALTEQWPASARVADMGFQPAHDMAAIGGSDQAPGAVDQAGIEQRHQRGEMRIVAVMRCGGQQQQSIGDRGQDPGEQVAAAIGLGAMMRLIDDHQVPARSFQLRQDVV